MVAAKTSQTDLDSQLLAAVGDNNVEQTKQLLERGANPSARDKESGLTALIMASGQANPELVKVLLDAGADLFAVDSRAGGSALNKACQGGSVEVVRLLVEAGAFVDWIAPTTGHTPLMDALWFKYPDIVKYLLDKGAGLGLYTHYGFSLMDHFQYELNVNVIGKDLLLEAEKWMNERQESDKQKINEQKLMKAVTEDDLDAVKKSIAEGADIDAHPMVSGFNVIVLLCWLLVATDIRL